MLYGRLTGKVVQQSDAVILTLLRGFLVPVIHVYGHPILE